MTLTARLRSTGEVISILDYEYPRLEIAADDPLCPHCGQSLTIRHGQVRTRHFAHRPHQVCPFESWHEPESEQHIVFKQKVREYLETSPLWRGVTCAFEVKVEEANRIADVMAVFATGWRVAHECQVSAITLEELRARTQAYWDAGLDVMWWFESGLLERSGEWLRTALRYQQGVILEATISVQEGERKRLQAELFVREPSWQVELAATDETERGALADRDDQPAAGWPLGHYRWREAVPAAVRTFAPGQCFTVQDLREALPEWMRDRVNVGRIAQALRRLWERGEVVKVERRMWARPGHPDFSAEEWRTFLESARFEGEGYQEEGSAAYHALLWQRQIEAAEDLAALEAVRRQIAATERSPQVRERLRPVYRERKAELAG